MDVIYFFKVLGRRIWLILGITAVAMAATYFLTGKEERVFLSTAKLQTGIVAGQDDEGKYLPQQKIDAKFNSLIEILNSKAVVDLLSCKLFINDMNSPDPFREADAKKVRSTYPEEKIKEVIASLQYKLDTLGVLSYDEKDRVAREMLKDMKYDYDHLKKQIKVDRKKDSDFLFVNFFSESPDLSAFAVNALCDEFIRYNRSMKSEQKNNSIAFYSVQVDEKLKALNMAKDEMNKFKLNNGIVDLREQQSSILQQIRELEMLKEDERKKIPSYQNTLENAERNEARNVISSYELQEKNRKINNLRNEISYLNDKYISGGSKDKKIQEQIEKLKMELSALISEVSSTTASTKDYRTIKTESEINLQIAKTSVASIDQAIQKLKNDLTVLVSLEPQLTALEQNITMAKQAYDEAVSKLSAAQAEAIQTDDALALVDLGLPASGPEPTKREIYSVFSGMLSLSFCIVLLFVLEYLDTTIKTPTQFEKFTNLRLLGYLNQINFINFNLDVNFIDINLENIFHNQTENQQLEQFKQLIRKIRFEIESTDSKRFLVTSTREHEGKTFLLISLAYSLSLNNKKVLLIDTNFKNNTLTNMLSAKPALEKHFNQSLVKDDIITRTKLKGIDVIGCYEGNYSPSEVFSQTNFHNLLNDLAQHYDFVFLEGAALNEYSDSKELISSVEKVISVFSTNASIKEQDKSSIAYLRGLGDKFMGAVLNKVELANLN
ncbi:MAG TPA: hypothetical protein VNJ07_13015 [Chitinophagales bacterium]|nr:hypothetical protein [Chitinophagales bacterium]